MKTSHTNLRRLGAGAATGALVASGLLLVGSPAQAADITVKSSDIAPDESTYKGWHQGNPNSALASSVSSRGLESIGKSQIINGYDDNTNAGLAEDGVNFDLSDLVDASFDVVEGKAHFQVPIFFDHDGDDTTAPKFATLRNNTPATANTEISPDDPWTVSQPVGDIPAHVVKPLSEIIDAVEAHDYKTIGFGVFTDTGETSTVKSITFGGDTYAFAADGVASTTVKNSQVAVEETNNNYKTWHQGYDDATGRQQVTAKGLELSGKSQVIKGFNNNNDTLNAVNANLAGVIPDASYTVTKGTAFFQIALRFDNGSGVQFATLRNNGAGEGKNSLSLGDSWQSSRAIGSIAANTDVKLSTIVNALGTYKVIAYGVLTNPGSSATVSNITFGTTSTNFVDAPAAGKVANVLPKDIAADESVYAGWHQGAATNTARIANGVLNLGADRSQVINGYANNSNDTANGNVDLAEALRTASYTVTGGDVFFQVPVFFEDDNGDTKFATLRPAAKASPGVNTFSIADEWVSSQDVGSVQKNVPAQLGDLLSELGSAKVIAFGVYSDAGGNGKVSQITWDGVQHTFAKVKSSTTFTRTNPTKPSSKKRFYVYATITAPGIDVKNGLVTVSNAGKSIGKGRLAANGKVKILLSRKIAKGNRTITITYSGTDQIAPSKHFKKVRIK